MFPKKFQNGQNWGWAAHAGTLCWEAHTTDPLPDGWARLELVLGGVCGTDLQILRGYGSFKGFLGHEFVGRVVECAAREWLGRTVVGEINVADGRDPRFAAHRRVLGIRELDGAFAQTFCLPVRNLHPVDDLDPALAVWCEPLAAALEAASHVPVGTSVAIVGDGRLGGITALALAGTHEVTVIGKHPAKLERLQRLGVAVKNLDEDIASAQWPIVIEASGSAAGLHFALQICEPQGTVILKSTTADAGALDLNPVVIKALRLIGSRCGRFAPALQTLRSADIDPRPLVDAILPLDRLPEGIQGMQAHGWVKVLVTGLEQAS
jgi:alcohol dehydrogenase